MFFSKYFFLLFGVFGQYIFPTVWNGLKRLHLLSAGKKKFFNSMQKDFASCIWSSMQEMCKKGFVVWEQSHRYGEEIPECHALQMN